MNDMYCANCCYYQEDYKKGTCELTGEEVTDDDYCRKWEGIEE